MKKQIPIDQQKGMFARCKKCKGYGYYWMSNDLKGRYQRVKYYCVVCNRTGRLDWIERITRQ